jgi:hypothetical protein
VCDVVVTSGRVTAPQAAMYAGLLCSQALGACWRRQVCWRKLRRMAVTMVGGRKRSFRANNSLSMAFAGRSDQFIEDWQLARVPLGPSVPFRDVHPPSPPNLSHPPGIDSHGDDGIFKIAMSPKTDVQHRYLSNLPLISAALTSSTPPNSTCTELALFINSRPSAANIRHWRENRDESSARHTAALTPSWSHQPRRRVWLRPLDRN